jgi:hypothetical protein
MRKVLVAVIGAAALCAGIWFGVGAALPGEFSVRRTRRIEASAERIYEWVGRLDRWPEWTVWNPEEVPGLAFEYPAAREGAEAVQLWRHPDGAGRLELTSAEVSRGIVYELTAEGSELATEGIISFAPAEGSAVGSTDVEWLLRGTLGSTRERWFGLGLVPRLERDVERSLERLAERIAAAPGEAPPPGG